MTRSGLDSRNGVKDSLFMCRMFCIHQCIFGIFQHSYQRDVEAFGLFRGGWQWSANINVFES